MKEIQSITVTNLRGMRTDRSPDAFEPGEALVAKNCRIDNVNEVKRRKGGEKYNTTQYSGAGNILGLYDFRYGTDSSDFIVAEDTVIYTDDGTTQTSIKTGQTAGNYYDFSSFDDFCWISNGADRFLKYDGTTVTNASISVPEVGTFAAAEGAAGNVDGTVKYLVTFYVSATGQESNPFTLANAVSITVANKKVNLTNIPVSSDSQVTARRIYRTTDGGSEYIAQLLTTISDNTSTTYTDNTLDANLGAIVNIDYDPAPVFKKTIIHKNRGFGITGTDSTLYFSKEFNVWYWPQAITDLSATANNFTLKVDPDNGEKLTNIVSYYDYILIFKTNSVYVLGGYDQSDFFIRKIDFEINVGCISSRAAIVAQNWTYFLDRNGVFRTNAQIIEYVGEPMEAFFDSDNEASELKVSTVNLVNAVMAVDQRKPRNLIRISMASSNSDVNDITLIYNFNNGQWSYDTGFNAQSYAVKCVDNQDFLIRGDDYGYVITEDQQEGDLGLIYSTATSGAMSTLTDTAQNMTVNLYKGAWLEILSGTSEGDKLKITSNTSDTFTVEGTFSSNPDTTSVYTVGGIDFEWIEGWNHYGNPSYTKRLKRIRARIDGSGDYNVTAYIWYDFQQQRNVTTVLDIDASPLWDVAVWDVDEWDSEIVIDDLIRSLPNKIHEWNSFGIAHKPAGEPVTLRSFDKYFQIKGYGFR